MLLSCGNDRGSKYPKSSSHEHAGVSGLFYDGSARWIDITEIDPGGIREATNGPDHMANSSASYPNYGLQKWAQSTLTLTK
jgi:hypothetical protein